MFKKTIVPVLALTTALAGATMATADTDKRVEVGNLSCDVSAGTGYVFGSTKEVTCKFNPAQEGLPDEIYTGTINRYGVDIGKTTDGKMSWLVLAPTADDYASGALDGTYGGVGAEATAGVGVGANIMTGGSDKTFALQPVSVQAQKGVNLAVGIAELELHKTAG